MVSIEDSPSYYKKPVEKIRADQYPLLKDTTYLDHAGTTLYAKSLIESFSQRLTSNLFGNPHSASSSSQLSTSIIDDARLRVLRFCNASPEDFDVVFVANATAGIKLVAESLRDNEPEGFWYGYHVDSHTSLVGVRNMADLGSRCLVTDHEVTSWINQLHNDYNKPESPCLTLFAYPGQSNMTGRRLPLSWCKEVRACIGKDRKWRAFTLFDAASLASTSPLDLSDTACAPDFTVVSFYKIFGFPDLGALIVRKDAGHLFQNRKYFGGGTVGMVLAVGEQWHAKKDSTLHDQLEDGTLPFHNIVALHSAFDVHERLYTSMDNISRHTAEMARILYDGLSSLEHGNGAKVCQIYKGPGGYAERTLQGPIISFNLKDSTGRWIKKSDVERLAAVKNIQIRSGTLCNPGGMAYYLGLKPGDMKRNYNAGQRCGDDNDIIAGKPTGGLRVSLGAMTSKQDINTFLDFIRNFYVENCIISEPKPQKGTLNPAIQPSPSHFYIEKLCIYPIKSCGAFTIPGSTEWNVKPEGLAWDREWCLIHQGTGSALNQKRYPRMALIRPVIDLPRSTLRVTLPSPGPHGDTMEIPLSVDSTDLAEGQLCRNFTKQQSTVCGDTVSVQVYKSARLASFFSDFLGVPCTLARFPPQQHHSAARFSKSYRNPIKELVHNPNAVDKIPGAFPEPIASGTRRPILLSNEGPILIISRSSVNNVNESIKSSGKPNSASRTVAADVFRANIIVCEKAAAPAADLVPAYRPSAVCEQPYIEELWTGFQVGDAHFDALGSCQRCQMICIDQHTATRSDEPFSTLAKTRKVDGKVYFGKHVCLSNKSEDKPITIKTGGLLIPFYN
ncbi:molybdenum cofactor sulfurase [Nannizzia gypsea CBS 118893]|uniref:Molybdenum cofactor sulfurase n=1 Tax=Arthroderma gypseum (strain ATCC MYA-4604 / CBS 118893) TaxID=535722 RepID=E4UNR8_ARTGP|nr:molybdenum cofactor sulfurase [Nannizzia gypsea CBS 118893]EFQ99671.1 molybdenum cofactor sulfurase [Nannizzia gypsea CBS 118893]